jgi:hypothetical protein
MDGQAAGRLAVVRTQPAEPGRDRRHGVGPAAGGDRGAELDEGMARRLPLAVERATPPDRELDLDHRLQPVDVGALEESNLDQSHGPGRIASEGRRAPG